MNRALMFIGVWLARILWWLRIYRAVQLAPHPSEALDVTSDLGDELALDFGPEIASVWPVTVFSDTTSGLLKQVEELKNTGFIQRSNISSTRDPTHNKKTFSVTMAHPEYTGVE